MYVSAASAGGTAECAALNGGGAEAASARQLARDKVLADLTRAHVDFLRHAFDVGQFRAAAHAAQAQAAQAKALPPPQQERRERERAEREAARQAVRAQLLVGEARWGCGDAVAVPLIRSAIGLL